MWNVKVLFDGSHCEMLIKTLTSLATDRAQGAVSILRPKAEFEREETVVANARRERNLELF